MANTQTNNKINKQDIISLEMEINTPNIFELKSNENTKYRNQLSPFPPATDVAGPLVQP